MMQNGNSLMSCQTRSPPLSGRSLPYPPTNSPQLSPELGRGNNSCGASLKSDAWKRHVSLLISRVLKRHVVLLLFPVIYISGMLLYMGTVFNLDVQEPVAGGPNLGVPPGSVYRSPEVFEKLWPMMERHSYAGSYDGVKRAWEHVNNASWIPSFVDDERGSRELTESNGFIIVEANGGLNQQRSSICNAVAVAYMLNATLVIPNFHLNSVWQDNSRFGQIYDEKHFIESLAEDVRIVEKLPSHVLDAYNGSLGEIYSFKITAWAPASFYLDKVLPKLRETGAVRFTPFANRLSFDNIPLPVQKLRCRTNFEALRFTQPIMSLADVLLARMVSKSAHTDGKFVGVHLRFEMDMVAFSCCRYDGGEEEKIVMDAAREKGWRGKFTKPGRSFDPGARRRDGKCPLTPLEVGMILRGMGFSNTTPIYLAAGQIYEAEQNLAPLRLMFPLLYTKETLLSDAELEPLRGHSTRMAALDYTVCLYSEVFVSTQGGNFQQILMGHRRILNNGHAKTIRPDKRKLAVILDDDEITWEGFSEQLQEMRLHSDRKGHQLRKPLASIFTFPAPECMSPMEEYETLVYETLVTYETKVESKEGSVELYH